MEFDSTGKPLGVERSAGRPLAEVSVDDDLVWALVDAAPDALVVIDDAGLIELVNSRAEELFGYSRSDLLGRPVEILVPDTARAVHRSHRTGYRSDPTPRPMGAGASLCGRRADGSELPVEISLSPVLSGDRQWIVAAVRDVSNRLMAERHGRAIRHAIDAAVDGIIIADEDTLEFTYVNRQCAAMHGYSPEEMIGMTPLDVAPELDQRQLDQAVEPLLAGTAAGVTLSTVALRSDGVEFPVEVHINRPSASPPEAERPFVAVVRDISDRVRAEQELTNSQSLARVLDERERLGRDLHDRVIGELFAVGLSLQAQVTRITDDRAAERVQETVATIDHIIALVRSTIFGLTTQPGEAGPQRHLEQQVTALHDRLGHRPRLTITGPIEELPDYLIDEVSVVIHEAVTNVAKHANATNTEITITLDTSRLTVTIADDGDGPPTARPAGPTGHGVANLLTRANHLNGTCTLEPNQAGGLTVTWTIPYPR
jgi:PAS domain S-box-containing protein